MHFYEGLPLSGFFDLTDVFDRSFGRFLAFFWSQKGHFGSKNGSIRGDSGPFLGRFGVILKTSWDHIGIVFA